MRVLVATDRIGDCGPGAAGRAIATGWQAERPGDELAVVPMGAAGQSFLAACADLVDPGGSAVGSTAPEPTIVHGGDLVACGHESIAAAAAMGARRLVVDLGGGDVPDVGAGMLGSLGATIRMDGAGFVSDVDLQAAREALQAVEDLVAVVPADEAEYHLLGLKGMTSQRGARDREAGLPWDPGALMGAEKQVEEMARSLQEAAGRTLDDAAGLGAGGGAAFALALLGARVVTGPTWIAEETGLAATLPSAEVVVTGTTTYDFAQRGGEAVEAVTAMAAEAMRPVVAVGGAVVVSARELRTHGVEAAYPVHHGTEGLELAAATTVEELVELGRAVARTWSRPR